MGKTSKPESLPEGVIRLGDGKLAFNVRWPKQVWMRNPDLKGKAYRVRLGTADARDARVLAAKARVEFDQECQRLSTPTLVQRRSEWLAKLTQEQSAKLIEVVDAELGRETKPLVGPMVVEWPDRNDSPVHWPLDEYEGEEQPDPKNPFLSNKRARPFLETTPERAMARLLENVDKNASLAAQKSETRREDSVTLKPARRLLFELGTDADYLRARRTEALEQIQRAQRVLRVLNFPADELLSSELATAVAEHVAQHAPRSAEPTLADALKVKLAGMTDERYKGQVAWSLRLFTGTIGDKPLKELETVDLYRFEEDLKRMPVSTTTRNAILAGKITVREAIDGAAPDAETLSAQSVAKHIDFVRSVCQAGFGKGLAGRGVADPFQNYQKTRLKKEKPRKHFTAGELERLFAEMQNRWAKNPDRRWISIIALFHGARREEICQSLKSDVRETDGIWCLHITTTPDDEDEEDAQEIKRLKTENSRRVIPIHQSVLDAGFLKYVDASPGPRIFASLTQDKDGRWGGNFGKRFGDLKGKAGIKGRRTLTFHSFRHTAITAMRQASWPYNVQLAVSGHAQSGSVGDTYGDHTGPSITKPWVDKLRYDAPAVEAILRGLTSEEP